MASRCSVSWSARSPVTWRSAMLSTGTRVPPTQAMPPWRRGWTHTVPSRSARYRRRRRPAGRPRRPDPVAGPAGLTVLGELVGQVACHVAFGDVVDGDAGAADAGDAALAAGVDPHGAVAFGAVSAGATAGGPPRQPVPVALLGGLRQRGPGVVH